MFARRNKYLCCAALSLFLLTPALAAARQPSLPQLRKQLAEAGDVAGQERVIAVFVAAVHSAGTPLIEGDRATFLYKGASRTKVFLAGDLTNWRPDARAMEELDDTGIFFLEIELPHASRWEYKIVADGNWLLDPWNSRSIDNGVGGENSFFTMPDYREPPEVASDPGVARGSLELFTISSQALHALRAVYVYTPPRIPPGSKLPSLYLQDGQEYLARVRVHQILDNMIAHGEIPPIIAVMIEPQDRTKEYWLNEAYVGFLVSELVPEIDSRFPTEARPEARTLVGASLGGLVSAYTACRHPEVFGGALSQSGAFQVERSKFEEQCSEAHLRQLTLDLTVGKYEGGLLESNRALRAVLEARRIPHRYREFDGGHNWTSWRDQLGGSLRHLLASRTEPRQ